MQAKTSDHAGGKKRKKTKGEEGGGDPFMKPPSSSELLDLQRTKLLFGSHLFRLQTEELIRSRKVKREKLSSLEGFLRHLKDQIDQMPTVQVNEGADLKAKYPFLRETFHPHPPSAPLSAFKLKAPLRVDLVGSFLLGSSCKPMRNVDVALEMDTEAMLEEKDFRNHKYLDKRAAFVAELFLFLKKRLGHSNSQKGEESGALSASVWLTAWQGDVTKPIVVVRPRLPSSGGSSSGWAVRLFPSLPAPPSAPSAPSAAANGKAEGGGPTAQWAGALAPQCGNLRRGRHARALVEQARREKKPPPAMPPSAYYNGLVAEDMRMRSTLLTLRAASKKAPAVPDAGVLLKVWALQRGLIPPSDVCGHGGRLKGSEEDVRLVMRLETAGVQTAMLGSGLSGCVLELLCAHVAVSGGEAAVGSAVQLLKLTLQMLAEWGGFNSKTPKGGGAQAGGDVVFGVRGFRRLGLRVSSSSSSMSPSSARLNVSTRWCLWESEKKEFNFLFRAQTAMMDLCRHAAASLSAFEALEERSSSSSGGSGSGSGLFEALFSSDQQRAEMNDDLCLIVHNVSGVNVKRPEGTEGEQEEEEEEKEDILLRSCPPRPPPSVASALRGPPHGLPFSLPSLSEEWGLSRLFSLASLLELLLGDALNDRVSSLSIRFFAVRRPEGGSKKEKEGEGEEAHRERVVCGWRGSSDSGSWDLGVRVGICLESGAGTQVHRAVDKGPSAGDGAAARQFRHFWGEKSELRRFKDSSILEVAPWQKTGGTQGSLPPALCPNSKSSEGAAKLALLQKTIVEQIILHTLKTHLPFLQLSSESESPSPLAVLHCAPTGFPLPISEKQRNLWASFSNLKEQLTSLESLPMSVKDLSFASPDLAYMEALKLPPSGPSAELSEIAGSGAKRRKGAKALRQAAVSTDCPAPSECVLEFQGTGGWPPEKAPLLRMKTALLLQAANEMTETHAVVTNAALGFCDFVTPAATFRVRVVHPRELLNSASLACAFEPVWKVRPRPSVFADLRTLWWRPALRSRLHALGLRCPAFPPSVALCKQWAARHLPPSVSDGEGEGDRELGGSVGDPSLCPSAALSWNEELVEMIVASLFMGEAGGAWKETGEDEEGGGESICPLGFAGSPQSPHVALSRFLLLLSTRDWTSTPLLVDPSPPGTGGRDGMVGVTEEEEKEARTQGAGGKTKVAKRLREAFERSRRAVSEFLQQQQDGGYEEEAPPLPPHFWVASPLDPHCLLLGGPPIDSPYALALIRAATAGLLRMRMNEELNLLPPPPRGLGAGVSSVLEKALERRRTAENMWRPLFQWEEGSFDAVLLLDPSLCASSSSSSGDHDDMGLDSGGDGLGGRKRRREESGLLPSGASSAYANLPASSDGPNSSGESLGPLAAGRRAAVPFAAALRHFIRTVAWHARGAAYLFVDPLTGVWVEDGEGGTGQVIPSVCRQIGIRFRPSAFLPIPPRPAGGPFGFPQCLIGVDRDGEQEKRGEGAGVLTVANPILFLAGLQAQGGGLVQRIVVAGADFSNSDKS
uniref:Nucleolar protein 6 n=1 Tax=Chromera velia CCMP2878 TaxID=1169474 RepID=A0A0G4I0D0_9ALVE|eukprot:Cvel_9914.t1-p1 / transcript=Cvel_9914.t1 / gene=Cvel_9914 / organism=Chromera_velia_CCMP2878 / gene_product=Nucleolar protein 6, putative / transcript_product=Nucleolar protein 6, putative / location=Cvel_scaffold585:52475-61194(-) / protein_length=1523 / sequence_SO=supercontig / SO=protein_coding / is_pseudo=false